MRLVYFSPVPWDSYEQRPHYFVRDFLAHGANGVEWINPYPSRLPNLRDLTRQDFRNPPLVLARPTGLTVHSPGGLPIDPLPGGADINEKLFWQSLLKQLRRDQPIATIVGIGRPTELALGALRSLSSQWSFYDAMDDFPEFYSGRSRAATAQVESEIAAEVSRIFVSSPALGIKFSSAGPPVTLLPNAFDMTLLPEVREHTTQPPHVGFIGCMGGWFDWARTVELANAISPVPVTLVGPVATAPPAALPPNIAVHPACPQPEAVRWLDRFSVGLIPFIRNTLTEGVDPIKYYQYRGAGLPVLSTRFGPMATRTGDDRTFFIDDPAGPRVAFERAHASITGKNDLRAFREENDWNERFRTARIWERP